MNGEMTNPPGLYFSRKEMKFGIIEQNFISCLEVFSNHNLVMPFLGYFFGNFGVQVSIIP